jgi:hypothetical protein
MQWAGREFRRDRRARRTGRPASFFRECGQQRAERVIRVGRLDQAGILGRQASQNPMWLLARRCPAAHCAKT